MIDMFGVIDIESLKENVFIKEENESSSLIIPEIPNIDDNNKIQVFKLESQIKMYNELLEESYNQNIKLKEKQEEKEEIIEKLMTSSNQENFPKLEELKELKGLEELKKLKELELKEEINTLTLANNKFLKENQELEDKLKMQEAIIGSLKIQQKEIQIQIEKEKEKETEGKNKSEKKIKINELTLESFKKDLEKIQKKKSQLSHVYSELILNEMINNNNESSIKLKNEEYESLLNNLKNKENEISKYSSKIQSLESIIQNLEEQYCKITNELKQLGILNHNLLENNNVLQSSLAYFKDQNQKIISNVENSNEGKMNEINEIRNIDSEKIKILTLEKESINQKLLNSEIKYEELKEILQKKDNLILSMKKELSETKAQLTLSQQRLMSTMNKNSPLNLNLNKGKTTFQKSPYLEGLNSPNLLKWKDMYEKMKKLEQINDNLKTVNEAKSSFIHQHLEKSHQNEIRAIEFIEENINPNPKEIIRTTIEDAKLQTENLKPRQENKGDILTSLIKSYPPKNSSQFIRKSSPFIPRTITELLRRSRTKKVNINSSLNFSALDKCIARYTTPSSQKYSSPEELISKYSPPKNRKNYLNFSPILSIKSQKKDYLNFSHLIKHSDN